ncbi:CBS domain protein [Natrialba magadii ATCC 43099]|uniref:CBS domain protein n=1 Tax=Natrialba magadii (strain ATCC 43099 / DSM 3394 / CCM 3739 / CIP 104546 / IAM 13178 / JCM 8861 / NBRC 102185 / NCIMB 2190 / MS3) TaxID=547559 RepID=D3SYA9_NATMM|nr:CBS domain-containing protein [Natrialba magadii]ADD06080.1 CBS domain protein [Natrialba magadii ATCC 43099]ELY30923.1 signal transduction protein with CBS domains [Natrialba magadii ATCC 43099]
MEDIFVGRIMSTSLHTVRQDTLVETAGQVMRENDIGSVIVVDSDNHLAGILTTTDFVDIVAQSQPKAETTVERYMTENVVTAAAQDSVRDAAATMLEHGCHHLPVVDEDEGVIGIVTTTDLASYLSRGRTPHAGPTIGTAECR